MRTPAYVIIIELRNNEFRRIASSKRADGNNFVDNSVSFHQTGELPRLTKFRLNGRLEIANIM